ncbi:hypothetical protein [Clostridium botulinum]|nr:hypothetical protein [Clostridium botulinum]
MKIINIMFIAVLIVMRFIVDFIFVLYMKAKYMNQNTIVQNVSVF